jgi:ADP-heptose:LPS heptosyltransferase
MQELTDPIKRPDLRIMGIEGEQVKVKGICYTLNKTITENFPNIEKVIPMNQEDISHLNRCITKNEMKQQ